MRFITDLLIISKKNGDSCHLNPPPGYEKIPQDFNEGVGGDWIYLCYKLEDAKTILKNNLDVITEIDVFNNQSHCIPTMQKDAESWIVRGKDGWPHDLNKGSGGDYIYITYKKIKFREFILQDHNMLLTGLSTNDADGYRKINQNCNAGHRGKGKAIYLYYQSTFIDVSLYRSQLMLAKTIRIGRQEQAFANLAQQVLRDVATPKRKCFISYAWEAGDHNSQGNKILHRRLKNLKAILERLNYEVFLDIDCMDGNGLRPQVAAEIENSSAVILICTPKLVEKLAIPNANVKFEYETMMRKLQRFWYYPESFKIIPLRFQGDYEAAVPDEIRLASRVGLTLDFTEFDCERNAGDILQSEYDSYCSVAQVNSLIHRLYYVGNQVRYHELYNRFCYERQWGRNAVVNRGEDDVKLLEDAVLKLTN